MRWLHAATLALLAGFALFWALTRPQGLPADMQAALAVHPGDAERGERVFWAGGCAGCHAAPGLDSSALPEERLLLTGGRRLESDFGTFVAPNVSMHEDAGIGGWTREEFAAATFLGVSPEGGHYYPSFPYTSYTRMTARDLADLWAFWQTLPADATPSAPHELAFPFTLRRGLGLWKLLNLREGYPTPEPDDAQVARGRYLSEALAHCAECHTPRDLTGAPDRRAWFAGAPDPSGSGRIPAIPGEGWSARDVVNYLRSGFTPDFDVVGGSMADVVEHMKQLPEEDLEAIAAYVFWVRGGDG